MLQQTFRLFDAEENQILTKTRFVAKGEDEGSFVEQVFIGEDCYNMLFQKIEDEAGDDGEWVESDGQTQVYSRDYREESGNVEWLNKDTDEEITAGRWVVESTYVDYLVDEVKDVIKQNAQGLQYVRVFLHDDGTIAPHFFSSHQWNDIDQQGQIELCSFEQEDILDQMICEDVDSQDAGDGGVHAENCKCDPADWFDYGNQGEGWLNDKLEEAESSLLSFEGEF